MLSYLAVSTRSAAIWMLTRFIPVAHSHVNSGSEQRTHAKITVRAGRRLPPDGQSREHSGQGQHSDASAARIAAS